MPLHKTEKRQSFALLSLRDECPAHRSFENQMQHPAEPAHVDAPAAVLKCFQMGPRSRMVPRMLYAALQLLLLWDTTGWWVSGKAHLFPDARFQGLAGGNGLWTHFTPACSFLFKYLHLFGHVPSAWPCFAGQSYEVRCINFFCLTDIRTSSFHLHCGKC